MNVKQFYGEKVINEIKKVIAYVAQATPEERAILIECFRSEARKQNKEFVRIHLVKLAEYIEQMDGGISNGTK